MSANQKSPALSAVVSRMAISAVRIDFPASEGVPPDSGSSLAATLHHPVVLATSPALLRHYDTMAAASLLSGDFKSAIAEYRLVLKDDPSNAEAWCNLGHAYLFSASFEQSRRCFYRSLAIQSGYVDAHMGLALCHLTLENFRQGWRHYERRRKAPQTAPAWVGEPLGGKRILVHAEQGLGDTIQFVRFVPAVAARGGEVVLQVQASLRPLLACIQGVSQLIATGDVYAEVDCQCSLLSLPRILAPKLAGVSSTVPYLKVPDDDTAAWSKRLTGTAPKVGLVWAGDPRNSRDTHRSISLESLSPLLEIAQVSFFSLQKGAAASQIERLPPAKKPGDIQGQDSDFANTAAAVTALDLIISVDTSVAHLAGALGKPVWILLPFVPDWRWLLQRNDSPWYPTARLFRQPAPGDWSSAIRTVADELQCWMQNR
jgi:tetratricopeptide (TPR) repeat protein